MDKNQALFILRQVQGLRDAFMGFNHVVDTLVPLIDDIAEADAVIEAKKKEAARLQVEISQLREAAVTARENYDREYNRLRALQEHLAAAPMQAP